MSLSRKSLFVLCAGLLILAITWLLRRGWEASRSGTSANAGSTSFQQVSNQSAASRAKEGPPTGSGTSSPRLEELGGDKVVEILKRLTAEYALRAAASSGEKRSRFGREVYFRLREGRLLALAYPSSVREHALQISRDPTKGYHDRQYACFVLLVLAENGDKAAEAELYRLAASGDMAEANLAFSKLASIDSSGSYRTLYWQKCREGSLEALRCVARWGDPGTVDLMNRVISANPGPEYPGSGLRLQAQENLQKLAVIMAPEGDSKILAILETPSHQQWLWAPWALEMARTRNLQGLAESLRKRLDVSENEARVFHARRGEAGDLPPFETEFVSNEDPSSFRDRYLDDVLVVQALIAGPLTGLEKSRLRTFGYACDPKQRLAEVLAELPPK